MQSYKIIILNLCDFICFRAYSLLGGAAVGSSVGALGVLGNARECSGMLADARGALVGSLCGDI